MNIFSSISSSIIRHTGIIIAGLTSYIFSLFILEYSPDIAMVLLVFAILLIFCLFRPKPYVYFICIFWSLMPMLSLFGRYNVGGISYYSVNPGGVIRVFSFVFGILYLFLNRVRIFQYKLTVPMLLFFAVTIMEVLLSPDKFHSFRYFVRLLGSSFLYFIILKEINDFEEGKRLLKLSLIFFIPVIIYGYAVLFAGTGGFGVELMRGGGTVFEGQEDVIRIGGLYHPNTFGTVLVFIISLSIFFFFETPIKYKWLYIILMVSMTILLIFTYSRVSWGEFLAVLSIVGFLKSKRFLFVILFAGACALAIFTTVAGSIWMRWEDMGTLHSRVDIWTLAWKIFLQSPIIGNGIGAVARASFSDVGLSQRLSVLADAPYGRAGTMTHSEFFRLIADGGIVALASYLFLIYRGLKISIQVFKLPYSTAKSYGTLLIAMIVIILLNGTTGHGFIYYNFYFFTYIAVGEIYLREHRTSPQ